MNLIGNINAIPFRRFRGGGGVSPIPPFPSISGMIARYSALGLTNEQMAENPIWVDKTGNEHDLQMKNFAWGGMSGVGGYTENYDSNRWYKVASRIDTTWTYKSFNVKSIKDNNLAQLFYQSLSSDTGFRVLSCTIKVSGLTDGQGIEYVSNGTRPTVIMRIENDGIYHLPSFDFRAKNAYYGFRFLKLQESCNITIEQLPLYPGALVFDGVDDYGTCDNFPILTKEKGYTVVALRQWITRGEIAQGLVSNVKNWLKDGAFLLEYRNIQSDHLNKPISFGAIGSEMDLPHILTYQTSKSYNGVSITTGNFEGTDVLHVGKLAPTNVETCINAAIWELVFLDHDATEEELTKIKDYFVKTYPWLFPDQAWTVVGKTNEDEDRATIANITGNGNDLVLSNFGFSGDSGYGLYVVDFKSIFHQTSDAITLKNHSFEYRFNETGTGDIFYILSESVAPGAEYKEIPPFVINVVSGTAEFYYYQYLNSGGKIVSLQLKNGRNELPKSYVGIASSGGTIGFLVKKTDPEVNISNLYVEQIPEYEGYLVTDGVDDKVQSSSFTMNEDWTIVGDWELLSNVQINCGIVKSQNVYLYNTANGLLITINNPRSLQSFGTKSLHAICSDGRLYDRNWVEYEYTVDQNFEIVKSSLNIGFNLNNYTQIAFKNLGIYNDQLLSKDDCIKAYNYLQTLKAK